MLGVVTVGLLMLIYSTGDISAAKEFSQFKNVGISSAMVFSKAFVIFGSLWLLKFIHDQTIFCTMYSAATFYFSSSANSTGSAEVTTGVRLGYFKHGGSIALGSLIINVLEVLRAVARMFKVEAEQTDNAVLRCCSKCTLSCINCLDDVAEYLGKVSYAFMAVSGQSFCTSAWNGFLLNLKHVGKFLVAKTLALFFVLMGVILIVGLNCSLLYLSLTRIT
jgi:hypothetical protein